MTSASILEKCDVFGTLPALCATTQLVKIREYVVFSNYPGFHRHHQLTDFADGGLA
jgi:hypothetical protein